MMVNKAMHLSILLLVVCVLFVSCVKKESKTSKSEAKETFIIVGFILPDDVPKIKELENAIKHQCEKRNISPILTYSDNSEKIEVENLKKLISDRVSAIAVYPVDSSNFQEIINISTQNNMPIFGINSYSDNKNLISNIQSDFIEVGRLAGGYMSKVLDEDYNVITIIEKNKSSKLISKGFNESISKENKLQIFDTYISDGSLDSTFLYIKKILENINTNKVRGFFVVSELQAVAVADYLDDYGFRDIAVVGYGRNSESDKMIIANSSLKAVVVDYPDVLGTVTVDTIANYLIEKAKVPKQIPVRVGIIDKNKLTAQKK